MSERLELQPEEEMATDWENRVRRIKAMQEILDYYNEEIVSGRIDQENLSQQLENLKNQYQNLHNDSGITPSGEEGFRLMQEIGALDMILADLEEQVDAIYNKYHEKSKDVVTKNPNEHHRDIIN